MPNQDPRTVQTNGKSASNTQQVGGMSKEGDMPRVAEPLMQETPEYEIPKEVAGHMSKVQEHIEIPPDLKSIGVSAPHSHGKVSDALQKDLALPLTDDQIGQGLQADVKSSLRWLAEWCKKQLNKAGYRLKEVGQHSIREKR